MRVAFMTEMPFMGKIPADHLNMRTEFAWMHALDANHHNIRDIDAVKDYDAVLIIFPKGKTFLSAEGSRLVDEPNPVSSLIRSEMVVKLKEKNKKVFFIQEGPCWWFNDYELADQINFINMLREADGFLAHNSHDTLFWKGYLDADKVHVIPTLMLTDHIPDVVWNPQDKVIVGGNFSRWYGGMQSYVVAQEFGVDLWTMTSHSRRDYEEQLIFHLPRVMWNDWMRQLSQFKYAVHLMPTAAAGTFSLNCAYLGIPCIGNEKMDTQKLCHPHLSVDVDDVGHAKELSKRLATDLDFYQEMSVSAKQNYKKHYTKELFLDKMISILK